MSNVHKGKLKFFRRNGGYGYIEYRDGNKQKEIYTHVSQFVGGIKSVKPGKIYKFIIGQNERGEIAQNVEVMFNAKTTDDGRTKGSKEV